MINLELVALSFFSFIMGIGIGVWFYRWYDKNSRGPDDYV